MKKFYFLCIAFAAGLSSTAQITLTAATHGITAGSSSSLWSADTTNFYAGPGGTAQTWDFSWLQLDTLGSTSYYFDPAAMGGSFYTSLFPTANLMCAASMTSGLFYNQTPTELSLVGEFYYATGIAQNYSDPQIVQPYPFSYGNTVTDAFYSTYAGTTHSGNTTITADGEGTLMLPWGSFPALRVKTMEHYVDVAGASVLTVDVAIYNWYTATDQFPVLQFAYGAGHLGSGPVQSFKTVLVNSAVVGIQENDANAIAMNVFPNPAVEQCTVNYSLNTADAVTITVCDVLGRTVQTIEKGMLQAGDQSETISLEGLSKGIYAVKVRCGAYSGCKKIQVL